MNKNVISLVLMLSIVSCKGPGSGPLVRDSFSKADTKSTMGHQKNRSTVTVEKMNVVVEPCDGCVKISDLLANKKSYSGKVIRVKGQVTKYNPGILGKNWVHIQDGSEFQGGFDLTITTDKSTFVGETVTFEGKVVLDKDFGYGYYYAVLMEEGKPVL